MTSTVPQLSRMRTFLLWALAIVWFSEMALWAVRPLAETWTRFWQQLPPDDPRLTTALYITHALEASAKGALGVLAVFALRSGSPSVRTALFVPMALVPPLNLAFQFRAQGFPLGPTAVGTTLSLILWGSFFFFKDSADQPPAAADPAGRSAPWRWESFQAVWLGATAAVLTLAAALFLFAPDRGLRSIFPCLAQSLDASRGVSAGLTTSLMAVGTHVLAVSIAIWIAAASVRRRPTVRQAGIVSSTLLAALVCVLPLRQIALDLGRVCALSSLLVYAILLFAAWVIYAAASYLVRMTAGLRGARPAVG
jgi:hypothetical protein